MDYSEYCKRMNIEHVKDNGFRDSNKFMSVAEGGLLSGAWVAAAKQGWPH